jgi:hypothetical protein
MSRRYVGGAAFGLMLLVAVLLFWAYTGVEQQLAPGATAYVTHAALDDAAALVRQYTRTHDPKLLARASMWLMTAAGILQDYTIHTNDGDTNVLALMVGDLGGDLALGQHVPDAIATVERLGRLWPANDPALPTEETSRAAFDARLSSLMRHFPPPFTTPVY